MNYIRKQYHTLKARMLEPRRFMQVLAGPRQVGKSTLVGQVLQDISIPHSLELADAVDPKDSDWIHRVWEGARTTMILRGETERLLVIDEIQKIDNWSERSKENGMPTRTNTSILKWYYWAAVAFCSREGLRNHWQDVLNSFGLGTGATRKCTTLSEWRLTNTSILGAIPVPLT